MQFLLIEIIFNLHHPISKVCSIKLFNLWSFTFFSDHRFYSNLSFDTTCWVPNNIITNTSNPKEQSHTRTQNLREKHFLFEGKNHGTNSKWFHCYQINYNNSCVCLMVKEKISLIFLYSHTHKLSLSKAAILCFLLSIFFSTHNSLLAVFFSLSSSLFTSLSSFSFLCGFLFLYSCSYSLYVFLKATVPYSLLPLAFLLSKKHFSLSWFHALFSLSP